MWMLILDVTKGVESRKVKPCPVNTASQVFGKLMSQRAALMMKFGE